METNKVNCSEVQELLSLYIDEMLSQGEKEEVERHLAVCENCRREYEALLLVSSLLGETEELPLPADFDERLRQALRAEASKTTAAIGESAVVTQAGKKKVLWKRIASIAAVFVIGIFGIVLYNNIDSIVPGIDTANQLDAPQSAPESGNTLEEKEMYDLGAEGAVENGAMKTSDAQPVQELDQAATGNGSDQSAAQDVGARSRGADLLGAQSAKAAEKEPQPAETADTDLFSSPNAGTGTRAGSPISVTPDGIDSQHPSRGLPTTIGGIGNPAMDPRDQAMAAYYKGLLESELSAMPFGTKIINSYQEDGLWYFDIEVYTADEDGQPLTEVYTYVGQDGILCRND